MKIEYFYMDRNELLLSIIDQKCEKDIYLRYGLQDEDLKYKNQVSICRYIADLFGYREKDGYFNSYYQDVKEDWTDCLEWEPVKCALLNFVSWYNAALPFGLEEYADALVRSFEKYLSRKVGSRTYAAIEEFARDLSDV